MASQPKSFITVERYLELDRAATERHEYYFGEMFAMAGGTEQHSALKVKLTAMLSAALAGGNCRVYDSDLRIAVDSAHHYTYADAFVICGATRRAGDQRDIVTNPAAVFEVLSPSTEAYDRGDKFRMYRSIESLREYVLVSQKRRLVERFQRQPAGDWLMTAYQDDDVIELPGLSCRIGLRPLYEGIDLDA